MCQQHLPQLLAREVEAPLVNVQRRAELLLLELRRQVDIRTFEVHSSRLGIGREQREHEEDAALGVVVAGRRAIRAAAVEQSRIVDEGVACYNLQLTG